MINRKALLIGGFHRGKSFGRNKSYLHLISSDTEKLNHPPPNYSTLLYGKGAKDINEISSKINNTFVNILKNNAFFKKYNKENLFSLESHAEGFGPLQFISDYMYDYDYLSTLQNKNGFCEIITSDNEFICNSALKDFSSTNNVRLKGISYFNFSKLITFLRNLIYVVYILFKVFCLRLLTLFHHKKEKSSFFMLFIQGSLLHKHLSYHKILLDFFSRSKISSFTCIWNLQEKISLKQFISEKDSYHLIRELGIIEILHSYLFYLSSLFVFYYNYRPNKFRYYFDIKLKNSVFLYLLKRNFYFLLYQKALKNFASKNSFKATRPWTTIYREGFATLDIISKIKYVPVFLRTYQFNPKFYSKFSLQEIADQNSKYKIIDFSIDLIHDNDLRNIFKSKNTFIYGNYLRLAIKKFVLSNSNDEEFNKLIINSNCDFFVFYIPNSLIKGYFSPYEFEITFFSLAKILSENPKIGLILKDRPGRHDPLLSRFQSLGLNNIFVFSSSASLYNLIRISDVVISKFSTILEESLIFGKRVLQLNYNKSHIFSFYDGYGGQVEKIYSPEGLEKKIKELNQLRKKYNSPPHNSLKLDDNIDVFDPSDRTINKSYFDL